MAIDSENVKVFPVRWSMAAKPCDTCKLAAALLFCRADSAFLCISCDAKIHGANKLASRHERVWMCEVCEQAPASVTCKADAAALCVTCDADIHSANPLARRHDRVPIVPFYDTAESLVKSSSATATATAAATAAVSYLVPHGGDNDDADDVNKALRHKEVEAASWILPNPNPKLSDEPNMKHGDLFFSDFDPFLDFDYANSMDANFKQQHSAHHGTDSIVPVQNKAPSAPLLNNHHSTEKCFDIDFCKPKFSPFDYATAHSLSHSVSSSSLDVGVVPDGSSMSDISYPFGKHMNGGGAVDVVGGCASNQVVAQLSGMDREARVLRYREKRKNRKFEKTIRYASRKAYAETRPRIKGRFAKRTEIEPDVDRIYGSAAFLGDAGYGVVPSF